MPLYSIRCPECSHITEHLQAPFDSEAEVPCESCGEPTRRCDHRAYDADNIAISGDTCSGSVDYSNYFDPGLNEFVTGRQHRERLMKEKGLTHFEQDPVQKKHHDESRYIRGHAPVGDPTAMAAAKRQGKLADQARKKEVRDKHLAKFSKNLESS